MLEEIHYSIIQININMEYFRVGSICHSRMKNGPQYRKIPLGEKVLIALRLKGKKIIYPYGKIDE